MLDRITGGEDAVHNGVKTYAGEDVGAIAVQIRGCHSPRNLTLGAGASTTEVSTTAICKMGGRGRAVTIFSFSQSQASNVAPLLELNSRRIYFVEAPRWVRS
jgi:hypothetical protein